MAGGIGAKLTVEILLARIFVRLHWTSLPAAAQALPQASTREPASGKAGASAAAPRANAGRRATHRAAEAAVDRGADRVERWSVDLDAGLVVGAVEVADVRGVGVELRGGLHGPGSALGAKVVLIVKVAVPFLSRLTEAFRLPDPLVGQVEPALAMHVQAP